VPNEIITQDAEKRRLFNQTVKKVRKAFSDLSYNDLQDLIAEAVLAVRRERDRQRKRRKRK
jgi:hypothetical protein